MNLLLIDLDGTITKSDNIVGFSLFMLFKKGRMRFLLFLPLVLLLKLKLIDNIKFKVWYATLILKNREVKYLNECASDYAKSTNFQNDLNLEVMEYIRNQSNTENVVLSANFDFLVQAIAETLSIKQCECIKLEHVNGKYTGLITGLIPYGIGKVEVYQQFAKQYKYDKTIGIGDSKSDLPILKHLDKGYQVRFDKSTGETAFLKV